jgi:DNA-binding ferritin-like protein (Dps family)
MSLSDFFNTYLNPIKILESKREWKEQMARVKSMPEEYQYVFEKIQRYMFMHAGGDGMDMVKIQYELIGLFEEGAASGRGVLDITGEDVAAFCDELLRNSGAKLWTEKWPQDLNRDIANKLRKGKK